MAFWPIKTKINTSSSTSSRGVPKQKNQHLQFRIEIMPKKEELYLIKVQIHRVMSTISRWTFVEHSVSALFKKKSLVSILRKFPKPWGSSSDNYFTKAWWAPCFLHLWIQARTHFCSLAFFSLYSLKNTCIYYYAQRNNYFIFLVIHFVYTMTGK